MQQDRAEAGLSARPVPGGFLGKRGRSNRHSRSGCHPAPAYLRGGRLYSRWEIWLARMVTFVALIAVWEIYGRSVSAALFAPPSAIVESYYRLVFLEDYWTAVGQTLGTFVIGLAVGILLGVGIGMVMGRWRVIDEALDPYLSFLYALPIIALVPLLLIWFGLGIQLRLAMVFIAVVIPVIINTSIGVKQVKPEYLDIANAFCANEWQIFRTVIFPASTPYIFAGIRIGLGTGLVAVVVVEMTAILTGVGGMLIKAANFYRVDDLFAVILTVMIIGVTLTKLIDRLGQVVVHTRRSWRSADPGRD